jgi:hypothetical protein
MSQEEEKNEDEGRIKVYITFKEKTVLFRANYLYTLKTTMENLKKLANTYPDKFWHLPEYDTNGQRITYFLAKQESKAVLHSTAASGEDRSLDDYGVKAGDHLKIIQKVVAG